MVGGGWKVNYEITLCNHLLVGWIHSSGLAVDAVWILVIYMYIHLKLNPATFLENLTSKGQSDVICLTSQLFYRYWSAELQRKKDGHSPRLFLTWLKLFWWRICLQGILLFIEVHVLPVLFLFQYMFLQVSGMVALSELLGSLTDYFVIESPSQVETRNAYLYAMGLGLISLCIMFFHGMNFHQGYLIGLHTKILMAGAIYQKVMKSFKIKAKLTISL